MYDGLEHRPASWKVYLRKYLAFITRATKESSYINKTPPLLSQNGSVKTHQIPETKPTKLFGMAHATRPHSLNRTWSESAIVVMIYVGWASSILWTNKKLNTLNLYDANDSTSVQFLLLLFSPCQTTTLDDHPLVKWYIISYYCHLFPLSSRLYWPVLSWLFNKYSQKIKI